MVIINVSLINGSGKIKKISGMGFLLDKNHVATCFHVVKEDSFKITKIEVLYNFNPDGKKAKLSDHGLFFLHDTVQIDISSKYYKEAILKHGIDSNIYKDFIVLPLSKKVKYIEPQFDTSELKKGNKFFLTGPTKYGQYNLSSITYIEEITDSVNPDCSIGVGYGFIGHGFSGTPVYNDSRKIVGILFAGFDTYNDALFKNSLSFILKGKVEEDWFKNLFNAGATIVLFIKIKSLMPYLK
jgi:hypothetical protein